MSSTSSRRAAWIAAVAAALLSSMPSGPALPQATSGGLSTVVPTLRGAVGDPSSEAPAALPDGTARNGIGGAIAADPASTDGSDPGGAPAPPPNKFAFPKNEAKTRDRSKTPRKGPPPLPPLKAYPTAVRLRGGVPIADTTAQGTAAQSAPAVTTPAPSVAALPVTTRLRTKVLDDGYTPLGLRAGSLLVAPYVAQSIGYDSNPDQTQRNVNPSAFSRTEGGIGLLSEWSAHELRADLRGGYNEYFSDPGANRPDAIGTIDLRLDVDRDTIVDAEQRFAIDTQRPGSPELSAATLDRPLITSFGETLGATRSFGRLSIGLHGSFDRVAYDDAVLGSGAIQKLSDENYDDYGLRLRGAYEITPVIKPFVDILVDDRLHDNSIDLAGFRRDSVGIIGQVGSSFEFNRLFSGEFSAGYGSRTYEDGRLKPLDGPVVNGSISYAVTPLTVVSLQAATTFDETTVAGSSGAESRSATLNVTHALLRNLTVTAAISYLNTSYTGIAITEDTLSETLKAEYRLSRSLVATAAYNHQQLHSTSPGSSFDQDVVVVGLRLQR